MGPKTESSPHFSASSKNQLPMAPTMPANTAFSQKLKSNCAQLMKNEGIMQKRLKRKYAKKLIHKGLKPFCPRRFCTTFEYGFEKILVNSAKISIILKLYAKIFVYYNKIMQLNLNFEENIKLPRAPKRPKGKLIEALPDNFCVVDIETTGFSLANDEIIELSAIKVRNLERIADFSMLINPKKEISSFISGLTGISNAMVKNQPDIKTVMKKFKDFVQDDIILGHNVRFDAGFLHREMRINFDENLSNDLVDTVSLAKKAYKLENYKLSTIAKHLNIDTKGAHRGLKDCEMTYLIYKNIRLFK